MAVKTPDYIIKGGTRTSSGAGGGLTYAEKPMGTLNGVNTVFTLTYSPVNLPSIWLELNGVWQQPPATGVTSPDYTISGNTITYAVAPASTDSHFIIYFIGSAAGTARGFGTTLGRASTDRVAWGNDAVFKVTGDLSILGVPSMTYTNCAQRTPPGTTSSLYITMRTVVPMPTRRLSRKSSQPASGIARAFHATQQQRSYRFTLEPVRRRWF
jgi:hypothetical protein